MLLEECRCVPERNAENERHERRSQGSGCLQTIPVAQQRQPYSTFRVTAGYMYTLHAVLCKINDESFTHHNLRWMKFRPSYYYDHFNHYVRTWQTMTIPLHY